MKHTGMIRRLDDIGRVVLPKEVRHKYRLREGDPVEICEGEKAIELIKYSPLDSFDETANAILREFHEVTKVPVVLCTLEKVCKAKGVIVPEERNTSDALYQAMIRRSHDFKGIIIADECSETVETLELIVVRGEAVGAVIIPQFEKPLTESHMDCLKLCAGSIAACMNI